MDNTLERIKELEDNLEQMKVQFEGLLSGMKAMRGNLEEKIREVDAKVDDHDKGWDGNAEGQQAEDGAGDR